MNILQDHTKRVKKLCGIFVLVIIVHAEHVADLLKNLRTESLNNYLFYLSAHKIFIFKPCIFLYNFSNSLFTTFHNLIQTLSSCLSDSLFYSENNVRVMRDGRE